MKYLKYVLYGIGVAVFGVILSVLGNQIFNMFSLNAENELMGILLLRTYGWIVTVVCTGIICSKLDKLAKKDKPDDNE